MPKKYSPYIASSDIASIEHVDAGLLQTVEHGREDRSQIRPRLNVELVSCDEPVVVLFRRAAICIVLCINLLCARLLYLVTRAGAHACVCVYVRVCVCVRVAQL